MPYAHTTWLELRSAFTARLQDIAFWTDAGGFEEQQAYLKEALRVWGSFSLRWKKRVTFQLDQDEHWYDLAAKVPELAYTIKDQDLMQEMQAHLLEPINQTTWTDTEQYQASDAVDALERRRNKYLMETGLILTRDAPATINLGVGGRVDFSAVAALGNVIDVRRLVWKATDGSRKQLWRTDEWAAHSYRPEWNLAPAAAPDAYSQGIVQPLELQLIPPPALPGLLEFITVKAGVDLDTSTGVFIGIPDSLSWIIKYAALEDMLRKEGPGRDTTRADYCKLRYEQGVQLSKIYPAALEAELNGKRQSLGTVYEMDAFDPDWETRASGTPERCGIMGLNLVCVTPAPDSNSHSLTLDVLLPAPIPLTDGTNLQLGKEEIDVILDYAVHIASFKLGGQEFSETMALYENMIQLASVYNEKLKTLLPQYETIYQHADQERRRRPIRTKRAETQ